MNNTSIPDIHWDTQPRASALVHEMLSEVVKRAPRLAMLRERLLRETGTRLIDWIDHLGIPEYPGLRASLEGAAFTHMPAPGAPGCYRHPGGLFPAIVVTDDNTYAVYLKVESVVSALAALGIDAPIAGEPFASLRRTRLADGDAEVWLIERHGYAGFDIIHSDPTHQALCLHHDERFALRRRHWDQPAVGFSFARTLIKEAVADLGKDLACDRFFAAERAYWQRRNRAARVQYERQQQLGFGWGNHDHHTFRSSRAMFTRLIECLELLGFQCRERFYPGHNAGWGAQVLEQPTTGIVVFADVDMTADELQRDFAHEPFPDDPQRPLGTVGLWCALHEDSFLAAGMHHLEATFDFEAARTQLAQRGIESMAPFTDFPHLRQCFTVGERWPVRSERVAPLVQRGLITETQAEGFVRDGAIGSHLELLERNDGFKGFNQTGVDQIIAGTDPRQQ